MSALQTATPPGIDPAAVPLSDERRERFAQLRVIGVPLRTAADQAGFTTKDGRPLLPGNAARLDREPKVIARKVFLARDEAEVINATRNFVRDRLMRVATLDVLRQFAVVETITINGERTSRIVGIDWDAWQNSDQSIALTSFKFDRETGIMTEFTRDSPENALTQLRDMYGLKAPTKTELTGKNGGPMEVDHYTDADRAKALMSFVAKTREVAKAG